jgi:site-specific DNA-methyltransferase (adenine-specific)
MVRRLGDEEWIRGDAMSTQGYVWFNRLAAVEYRRLLPPGGHVLSFADWRMAPLLSAAFETADLRIHPTIVWDKAHFGMGAIFRNQHEFVVHASAGSPRDPFRRDVGNVIRCPTALAASDDHPNRKPVGLLSTLISVVSGPGGLVLDCMAGSGSTAEAARMTGRPCLLIEADERYCETIARRMSQGVLVEGM